MTAFSWQWLEVTLDTAAKSLFLAALAAGTIWVFKVRNSHVRHRLWTGVLAGMLMLPLLSRVVPQLRLPVPVPQQWLVPSDGEPDDSAHQPLAMIDGPASANISPDDALDRTPTSVDDRGLRPDDSRELGSLDGIPAPRLSSAPGTMATNSGPQSSIQETAPAPLLPKSATQSTRWPVLRNVPYWLAMVWLLGFLIMLIRLMCGLAVAWRLRRTSLPIVAEDLDELGVGASCWPSRMRSALLECPLISVPLTLGVFRPVVLLPAEWLEWPTEKLESVLLHERMHVERRDSAIAVLSELNVAVNWLNPLSWWLRQRLSLLAEEACDDAAILCTGDRTRYARHLLEVAAAVSTSRSRLLPATVSMARRSNVESRINAILDFTRPLSQRPTWATALLILLVSGPIIALAAALTPGRNLDRSTAPETASAAPSVAIARAPSTNEVAQAQPAADQKLDSAQGKQSEAAPLTIRGRVLDPVGKTVAGADVMIRRANRSLGEFARAEVHDVTRLTSGANGEFEYTFAVGSFDNSGGQNRRREADLVYVLATKAGSGMAINATWNWAEPKPLDVSLTVNEPIRGKLIDAEGRPVAGAVVRVVDVYESTTAEVDQWLSKIGQAPAELGKGKVMAMQQAARAGQNPPGGSHDSPVAEGLLSTKTGADGSFELQGIGHDQRAVLQISAEKLAVSVIDVLARPIDPIRVPAGFGGQVNRVFYGSTFSYVLEAGFSATGRLTDTDSGLPIVGAEVIGRLDIMWDYRWGQLKTKTDADGRFRIDGLPWSGDNGLRIDMPNLPYLGTSHVRVPRPTGVAPTTIDLKFKRSVWASGQVTDVQTGHPVVGNLFYSPFENNEFVKLHPSYSTGSKKMLGYYPSGRTTADGRFRIPVIQGRGIVCFRADEENFAPEAGREKIPEFADPLKTPQVTIDHGIPTLFHAISEVNPAADATEVTVDVQADSGRSITLHLVDQQNRAITGTRAVGIGKPFQAEIVKGSDAILKNVRAGEVRRLDFVNEATGDRAKLVFQSAAGQTEVTVTLLPAGRIIGRLVDPDGRAIANAKVSATYVSTGGFHSSLGPSAGTDKDGRFSQEVTAGEKYGIEVSRSKEWYPIILRRDLVAEPGETIDIGDFEVDLGSKLDTAKSLGTEKRSREPWRKAAAVTATNDLNPVAASGKSTEGQIDADTFRYAGTVVDEGGQPVEGATVTLTYWQPTEDKPKQGNSVVSDAKGQFELIYRRSDFTKFPEDKPWTYSQLVATKRGYGFAASPVGLFETTGNALKGMPTHTADFWKREGWPRNRELKLCTDLPIRGRIVDIEGRPVVGALLEPFNADEGNNGSLDAWEAGTKKPGANFYTSRDLLRRLFGPDILSGPVDSMLAPVKTDAEGYFTLEGVGRERLVSVVVSGPNIESSILRLRSRVGETIKLSDSDRDDGRFFTYYPTGFTHVAGPSQPVAGVVTDLKTGKPVAGAFVRAESTATYNVGGSAGFIRSTTDQDGRYRLTGFPPGTNRFVILPPAQSGYHPAAVEVKTAVGTEPLVTNVTLVPGVRARGIVKEAASGKPIRGYVSYFAFKGNPALQDFKGFQLFDARTHFRTDSEGRFEIPVLPGPGLITFSSHDHFAYPRGEGADKIKASPNDRGSGSNRIFSTQPHMVMQINYEGLIPIEPAVESASIDVTLTLTALQSFKGRVVAEDGSAPNQFVLQGENIGGGWYRHTLANYEVKAYSPAAGRRLIAYDPSADAIGLLDVMGDSPANVEIKLQRASRIVGRLVDDDGLPMAGVRIENDLIGRQPSPIAAEARLRGKFDPERAAFVVVGSQPVLTDDQGRFELLGVMPGLKYSARVMGTRKSGNRILPTQVGSLFTDVIAKAGEKHDLGDVKMTPSRPR